jgi:hypothetical protein
VEAVGPDQEVATLLSPAGEARHDDAFVLFEACKLDA